MQKAALWQMVSMLLQAFAIFLTGFALLHSAETAHYALFALSQVVQGTANGVVNALCASPLLLLMNSGGYFSSCWIRNFAMPLTMARSKVTALSHWQLQ